MPKRTVSAKEILADIRAEMTDEALMEKYGLLAKGDVSMARGDFRVIGAMLSIVHNSLSRGRYHAG